MNGLLPKSLASRTVLILLIGFAMVQGLGLLIHTLNQIQLEEIESEREFATRAVIIYRHVALAPEAARAVLIAKEPLPEGDTLTLSAEPPNHYETRELPLPIRQFIRASMLAYGIPLSIRPHGIELRGMNKPDREIISFGLPDSFDRPPMPLPGTGPDGIPPELTPAKTWLILTTTVRAPAPWRTPGFATAFVVMSALGGLMIFWAVRQLLVPVRTLALAAEALGRDVVNAPALPEKGPTEIITAAIAFNTMAERIRRFVDDRTFLITAIGHDLRTPITRLKLRAEYMDDDEQRIKMLADLDEMEAMIAATLAFGRDVATSEALTRLDLAILLRTILDEAADVNAEQIDKISYKGPEHQIVNARPLAIKRALTNLIGNALKYGDGASVSLSKNHKNQLQIDIDDEGPGISPENMETVFEPFRRLETSRNRETGGSGLGLSIVRNIIRAHGGDVTLSNLPNRGLRARVILPA